MVVRRTSDGRSRLEDVCPYLDVAKVYIRDFNEISLENIDSKYRKISNKRRLPIERRFLLNAGRI